MLTVQPAAAELNCTELMMNVPMTAVQSVGRSAAWGRMQRLKTIRLGTEAAVCRCMIAGYL